RAVAVATIVFVALLAGVTTASIGLIRATIAEQNARRDERTATKAIDTLMEVFRSADPSQAKGKDVRVIDVLDANLQRISKDLVDEPEIQSRLMHTLGTLFNNMAAYNKAVPTLEQALAQRELVDQQGSEEVANILADLGEARRVTDDVDGARRAHARALEMRRALLGNDALPVANSLRDLAIVERTSGNYKLASDLVAHSISVARALDANRMVNEALAASLNAQAVILSLTSDLAGAEMAHREALAIKRLLFGELHPSIATTLNNLGAVLAKQAKLEEAETAYRQALSIREKVFKQDNPRISTTLNNLALTLLRKNELVEAESLYRRSLAIRLAEDPRSTAVATALNNLAGLLRARQDESGAEAAYLEALDLRRSIQGTGHPHYAITQMNLAEHLDNAGQRERSCAHISEAIVVLENTLDEGHWRQAMAKSVFGACLVTRGEFAKAEPLLLEGYADISEGRGDRSDYARNAVSRIVRLYKTWQRPAEQEKYESLLASLGGPAY
ncbi:MAG: tetratricopeptide repeat protein, partial [Gammaproteobacteria bacterium]